MSRESANPLLPCTSPCASLCFCVRVGTLFSSLCFVRKCLDAWVEEKERRGEVFLCQMKHRSSVATDWTCHSWIFSIFLHFLLSACHTSMVWLVVCEGMHTLNHITLRFLIKNMCISVCVWVLWFFLSGLCWLVEVGSVPCGIGFARFDPNWKGFVLSECCTSEEKTTHRKTLWRKIKDENS